MRNLLGRLLGLKTISVPPYEYFVAPTNYSGIMNLSPVQFNAPIYSDVASPRYNVRRSLKAFSPAFGAPPEMRPETDLRANGAYLSGNFELNGLVEFEMMQEE